MKFYSDRITANPSGIEIDEWGFAGAVEGSNGTASSTNETALLPAGNAFGQASYWKSNGGVESGTNYRWLEFAFSGTASDAGSYTVKAQAANRAPRNWDIEYFVNILEGWKTAHVVRDEPVWTDIGEQREYTIHHDGGRHFYRLNVSLLAAEFDAPSAPNWSLRINALEMYDEAGGYDLCHTTLNGHGDADDAYSTASRAANAFDGEDASYWMTTKDNGAGDDEPKQWLRFYFPLDTPIRQYGILQPLVVTRHEEAHDVGITVYYELIAGERRLRASKLAKLTQVPVVVRTGDDSRAKLELAIIENLQREDMNELNDFCNI